MNIRGSGLADQRGVALPLVLGIMILVFLLVTATLSQSLQARHSTVTDWQMIRAQYAAESGIARMQEQLCEGEGVPAPLTTHMNGMEVSTAGVNRGDEVEVVSVATGQGVRQTIRVQVDPVTCQITRWER